MMAVLAEAISVIVLKSSIDMRFKGGASAFVEMVPNGTLCEDDDLYRVGFMAPVDVEAFVGALTKQGLVFTKDGQCIDIAVVDQMNGPTLPCDWIQFARIPFESPENRVSICWYFGGQTLAEGLHFPDTSLNLSVPRGWEYRGSMSQKVGFIDTSQVEKKLKFLRDEDGILVYFDSASEKEVYIARAAFKSHV